MSKPLLSEDFVVPTLFETDQFRLRMLSIEDVELDYEAVMTSREHLRSIFAAHTTWPADDMTRERDLEDLRKHQHEFETRIAFAYTVVSLDERLCLGCVYIYPVSTSAYDAHVYLWVRSSELEKGLDSVLFATVKTWIAHDWPFQHVAYPGRDIDWTTWKAFDYKEQ
ncbi:MAG: GNAT family N-acetyltransferase [Ktedonobacteraceae bacterium]|nr:GNAT family N-acetyltransferase [Ktedonobacteraceae bacterium]